LEEKFRGMVDLAEKHPELLKWKRFVEEINETESRINDAFVKLEKYEKMMDDVGVVLDAWPDTNYNPLKAVYQTAQRPVIWGWKGVIGEKSVLNKVAARARYDLEGVVHDFVMEDENDLTSKAEGVIEEGGEVAKKVARKAVKKATDFIDEDNE